MSKNEVASVSAKCPFYHKEDKVRIMCEGIAAETSIHIVCRTRDIKKEIATKYCYGMGYVSCPIYAMVATKYEE